LYKNLEKAMRSYVPVVRLSDTPERYTVRMKCRYPEIPSLWAHYILTGNFLQIFFLHIVQFAGKSTGARPGAALQGKEKVPLYRRPGIWQRQTT
jgi:hypothetical protein